LNNDVNNILYDDYKYKYNLNNYKYEYSDIDSLDSELFTSDSSDDTNEKRNFIDEYSISIFV
jgi:hypothetical protein